MRIAQLLLALCVPLVSACAPGGHSLVLRPGGVGSLIVAERCEESTLPLPPNARRCEPVVIVNPL